VPHDIYIAAVFVASVLAAIYAVLAVLRVRGPAVSAAIVAGGILEAFRRPRRRARLRLELRLSRL
jgi:hypothetical protein